MVYRFPIVEGDRVALAPHLDLWMAGIRFGKVLAVAPDGPYGARVYTVWCNERTVIKVLADSLLGAVNSVPGQGEPLSRTERGCYCSDLQGVLCGVCRS